MNIKIITAVLSAFLIIFSLTACTDKAFDIDNQEQTIDISTTEIRDLTSENTVSDTTESSGVSAEAAESETSLLDDDPENWSVEKIVDVYKSAAKKSDKSVKSQNNIELKSISVNNGEYEGLFEFITPIMSKLIKNNSELKDGITGGYNNLVASDVASAKAYKIENNTVIEMVMKKQISGASDDALSGSVGHAITAVGDISEVTNQLKDLGLPLELSEKDTKIYYTKPVVRVLINSNGEIIKGTWSYTVEIKLNNYKAFGKAVNTTSVVMDNTITVNGGFSE